NDWGRRVEEHGRHEPRRSRSVFDQEGARPEQRQRAESGRGARAKSKRVLPAFTTVWALKKRESRNAKCGVNEKRPERSVSIFAPGQTHLADSRRGRTGGRRADVDPVVREFQ